MRSNRRGKSNVAMSVGVTIPSVSNVRSQKATCDSYRSAAVMAALGNMAAKCRVTRPDPDG